MLEMLLKRSASSLSVGLESVTAPVTCVVVYVNCVILGGVGWEALFGACVNNFEPLSSTFPSALLMIGGFYWKLLSTTCVRNPDQLHFFQRC